MLCLPIPKEHLNTRLASHPSSSVLFTTPCKYEHMQKQEVGTQYLSAADPSRVLVPPSRLGPLSPAGCAHNEATPK